MRKIEKQKNDKLLSEYRKIMRVSRPGEDRYEFARKQVEQMLRYGSKTAEA